MLQQIKSALSQKLRLVSSVKSALKYQIQYWFAALSLLLARDISCSAFAYVVRSRPIAVCGKNGTYFLCPHMNNEFFSG
ncbi:hypothetical protein ACI2KR_06730 [Pseudomonas luteola]